MAQDAGLVIVALCILIAAPTVIGLALFFTWKDSQ